MHKFSRISPATRRTKAHRVVTVVGVLLVASTSLATANTQAIGEADTSPPTFTKKPTASIPLGAVLNDWQCVEPNDEQMLSPIYIDYNAADPESGIDHYEHQDYQGEPVPLGLATRYETASWTTDPADCFGGGRVSDVFAAFNGVGLSTHWWAWSSKRLGAVQDNATAGVTYQGAWTVSRCACWSEATTHRTTQQGASVRIRFTIEPLALPTKPDTGHVALVMAKGPDRGAAAVFLDGDRVGIVDTHAATKVNRTVVWRAVVAQGSHTLRVVNRATIGHPRIDLDAVVSILKGTVDTGRW